MARSVVARSVLAFVSEADEPVSALDVCRAHVELSAEEETVGNLLNALTSLGVLTRESNHTFSINRAFDARGWGENQGAEADVSTEALLEYVAVIQARRKEQRMKQLTTLAEAIERCPDELVHSNEVWRAICGQGDGEEQQVVLIRGATNADIIVKKNGATGFSILFKCRNGSSGPLESYLVLKDELADLFRTDLKK